MSVRYLLIAVAAALLVGFGLAAPAAAHVSVPVRGITIGRSQAIVALVVGLISVVIGGLALARSAAPAEPAIVVG
jgi:hypothetical protein